MERDLTEGQAVLAEGFEKTTSVHVRAQMLISEGENMIDSDFVIREEFGEWAILEESSYRGFIIDEAFRILNALIAKGKITRDEAGSIYEEVGRILDSVEEYL